MMSKKLIFDLDFQGLSEQLRDWSEPNFRTKQIWQGLYLQLYDSVENFTTIPQKLKETITVNYSFSGLNAIDEIKSANGQTVKVLFELKDGLTIESVLMHYQDRETVCVSTQVGCAVGCTFCATGKMGLHRNLTSGEIVEQVLFFERDLLPKGKKVTNIVFMGMGEPFQNFENTLKAIDTLHHPEGLNLGERRFTVSTVGIPDKIRQFANMERQINLAVSLHTPFNQKRTEIIPINRRFPISEVMAAVKYYLEKTNRRVSFEYALIAGENDSPKEALALAELLRGLICHVNLIPVNPISTEIQATKKPDALKFQRLLEENGIPCSIRLGRGIDIQAGCGQLASRSDKQGML